MFPIAILAGGVASRMRPRTDRIPKALLEVAGRPFIAHQLALLREQHVTDVVLCVGHFASQIEAYVGDGRAWDVRVRYSVDGPVLLGTGGALRQAQPLLGETFFVMYGDSYLPCDFTAVAKTFAASGQRALMTVFRNDNRLGASNVLFEHGRIVRYDKMLATPAMRHIDYGLTVLTAEPLSTYPADTPFDLSRVYQDLVAQGQLAGLEIEERFFEIGSPEGLRDTEALLAQPRPRS
jgi:N-acetyl-alpha-D-muramate 1-phosphate uridylyltransferase